MTHEVSHFFVLSYIVHVQHSILFVLVLHVLCGWFQISSCISSEEDECLRAWINDLGLTEHDKQTLQKHAWLSANHISAANVLLQNRFPKQNGLQDTMYLAEKFQWTSSTKKFVQIIHVGGCHWACLSNKFSSDTTLLQFYDSLLSEPETSVKEQACTIIECEDSCFKIQVMNVQVQQSGDACGLYAIAMALSLCAGEDPCYCAYKETEMRNHLACCFESRSLSLFPYIKRTVTRRIIEEVTVPVYCFCRYPDVDITSRFGSMMCCDCCNKWYHQACLNLSNSQFKETIKKTVWTCPNCS